MNENPILYREDGAVATMTLNRPDALNALNKEMLQRLSQLLDEVKERDDIRAIVLTGSGGSAFCAGADIKYLNAATPLEVRDFAQLAVTVTTKIESLGKLSIAAINGHALGGGLELAEACMLRVAVRSAKIGHPEVRIGAVAGFGGTTRLPRLVGKGRAAEMLLRGRAVGADEALNIGLVQSVVDADELFPEVSRLLADILQQSPIAVQLTWEAMHRGLNVSLEESASLGADFFGLVASTEDFRIGTEAFINKRKPDYINR